MTDSQLPQAATAQKFGTLIPNRIFGEFEKKQIFRLTTNCILSFPFISSFITQTKIWDNRKKIPSALE